MPRGQNSLENPMVSFVFADRGDGKFWIDVLVNGQPYDAMDFDTATERQRACDDMLEMLRSVGGKDMLSLPQ